MIRKTSSTAAQVFGKVTNHSVHESIEVSPVARNGANEAWSRIKFNDRLIQI